MGRSMSPIITASCGKLFRTLIRNKNLTVIRNPSLAEGYMALVYNGYIITWMLHQIFMFSSKVKLAAG